MRWRQSIAYEFGSNLIGHEIPERSIPGIIVAAFSVIVMPLFGKSEAEGLCGDRERSHGLPARDLSSSGPIGFAQPTEALSSTKSP